jgi:hypothetical protein
MDESEKKEQLAARIAEAAKTLGPFVRIEKAFLEGDGCYFVFVREVGEDEHTFAYAEGEVHGPFLDVDTFEWVHGSLLIYASDLEDVDVVIYRGVRYGPKPGTILWFAVLSTGAFIVFEDRTQDGTGTIFLDGRVVFEGSDFDNIGELERELFFTAKKPDGERVAWIGGSLHPYKPLIPFD